MAVCVGTRRDGTPCTVAVAQERDYCYHHDPDPEIAARRSRNASKAATLGNSRIGAEIRSTRLLVRDMVEMTVSNELHPLVRKRLTEIVQLLQTYARLAELEIAAGERPRAGAVALPENTSERIREWAEGEEIKVQEREELAEEVSQAMLAYGKEPRSMRDKMGR